jgi:hypothetical protein
MFRHTAQLAAIAAIGILALAAAATSTPASAQKSASGSTTTNPPPRQPTMHNTKNSRFFHPGCSKRRGCKA